MSCQQWLHPAPSSQRIESSSAQICIAYNSRLLAICPKTMLAIPPLLTLRSECGALKFFRKSVCAISTVVDKTLICNFVIFFYAVQQNLY